MGNRFLKPLHMPKGVEAKVNDGEVKVKGPKGELSLAIHKDVNIELAKDDAGEYFACSMRHKSKSAQALTGTMRALINNMMQGVTEGFSRQLDLVGVGYRAAVKGKSLQLNLGFSHPIDYALAEGVTAEMPNNTTVILKSIDKQKLGQVAAEIRAFRPPEPYKGKGVKYSDERIVRKETKKK